MTSNGTWPDRQPAHNLFQDVSGRGPCVAPDVTAYPTAPTAGSGTRNDRRLGTHSHEPLPGAPLAVQSAHGRDQAAGPFLPLGSPSAAGPLAPCLGASSSFPAHLRRCPKVPSTPRPRPRHTRLRAASGCTQAGAAGGGGIRGEADRRGGRTRRDEVQVHPGGQGSHPLARA